MGNRLNLEIGEMQVYFDKFDGQGERDLGYTKGGVTFSFEREFTDLTVDQFGTAPLDMALTGQNLTITLNLAEISKANLALAIPEGRYDSAASDAKLSMGRQSGYRLFDVAGQLRLHPKDQASSARDKDIYIWKAVSNGNIELNYTPDEQRVLSVEMRALVDENQVNGRHLGQVGDNAIS